MNLLWGILNNSSWLPTWSHLMSLALTETQPSERSQTTMNLLKSQAILMLPPYKCSNLVLQLVSSNSKGKPSRQSKEHSSPPESYTNNNRNTRSHSKKERRPHIRSLSNIAPTICYNEHRNNKQHKS